MAWNDIIDMFMELTAEDPSPKLFRLWTAISMVGASLERRVYCRIAQPKLYANLYTLLVGPPGRGKTTPITRANDLVVAVKKLNICPSNVNSGSVFDALSKVKKSIVVPGPVHKTEDYHSMYVLSGEFGVFLPEYDRALLQQITFIFDNPLELSTQRIHRGKEAFKIALPQLNILGATTPSYLSEFVPESAWSGGFCARFLLVYCQTGPKIELFKLVDEDEELAQQIVAQLAGLETRHGQMGWEPQAAQCLKRWYDKDMPPQPDHPKLEHYCQRRQLFVSKLAMIKSLASNGQMFITHRSVEWAIETLVETEETMPDVFRAMAGKSDDSVISELHLFVSRTYNSQNVEGKRKKSVPESMVYAFLRQRLPSEKVEGVLQLALKSGVIAPGDDGLGFSPKPRVDLWRS